MTKNRTAADAEFYRFSELVDIASFTRLLDSFFKATSIPNGLVGPDGEIISQSGWTDACALFHRGNPDTTQQCQESNLELMRGLQTGKVSSGLCQNGLYDYATPIIIEGQHLATLFLGQVLTKQPDMEYFRKQAKEYGFEEEAYLDAIRAVPVVGIEQMQAYMDYMVEVAQVLAATGLARLRQNQLERDLSDSTKQRIQMEDLLNFSPVGISWCNAEGKVEYVNHQFTELFGYTLADLPDFDTWIHTAFPNRQYRDTVVMPWVAKVLEARQTGSMPPELEADITCKDDRVRRVVTRISWIGEKRLANFTDITAHWQSELRNRAHSEMLEMVAKAKPLSDILNSIVREIEAEEPSSLCSILLLDAEEKHLYNGAAPNLPAFYNEAIDGIEIGMGVGSCGTAAYLGTRVIVENVLEHEYWQPYTELAKEAGLGACWSEPIMSSSGKVLGTFAIYHAQPTSPTLDDIERITFAANLAAIAIENQHTREELFERERAFRSLAENAPDNIARYDLEGQCIYANPTLAKTLGINPNSMLHEKTGERPEVHFTDLYDSMVRQVAETGKEVQFEVTVTTPKGEEHHLVHMVAERDEQGKLVGVLAIGRDITERKRLEWELERQAHLDFLTGLANRRRFINLAENELSRIHRHGGQLSLLMFDIDFFKQINDSHGHNIGDQVLQKIAQVSRDTMREIDTIGRFGGEEFVVLLPHTDNQQATEAAERLRLAIAEGGLPLENGKTLHFTASFGVVSCDDGSPNSIDELLNQADAAMYQAKEIGRNRVCQSPLPS